MLTHSIYKHVEQPASVVYTTALVARRQPQNPARMDKLAYATFLATLPFTKGSIIKNKWIAPQDLRRSGLFVVEDIQEIHFMCEQGEREPKCLYVKNSEGVGFWTEPWRWLAAEGVDLTVCG